MMELLGGSLDTLRYEPTAKRVRAFLAGEPVVDTTEARLVWEPRRAIPFFNARADNGQNYRVLFQAPAPEGISGMTLTQGKESNGKIYFDVTGAKPTTVAYNDAVSDRLVWSA